MSFEPPPVYFVGSAFGPRDAEASRKVKEFMRTATAAQRQEIFVLAYFNVLTLPRTEVDARARVIEALPRYEVQFEPSTPITHLRGLTPPEARNTRRCFSSDDALAMVTVTDDLELRGALEVRSDGGLVATGVLAIEGQQFERSQIDDELRRVLPKYIEQATSARVSIALRGVKGLRAKGDTQPIEMDVLGPVEAMVADAARDVPLLVERLWQTLRESMTEG
jgi:hypothetical protein